MNGGGYMYINTSYCVDLDLVASHTHILVCVCARPCACTHMFAFIPYTHITYECGWLAKVCMCVCVCVCAHMSAGSPVPFSIFLFLIPPFILLPFLFNQKPLSFSLNFLISIHLSIYPSIFQ